MTCLWTTYQMVYFMWNKKFAEWQETHNKLRFQISHLQSVHKIKVSLIYWLHSKNCVSSLVGRRVFLKHFCPLEWLGLLSCQREVISQTILLGGDFSDRFNYSQETKLDICLCIDFPKARYWISYFSSLEGYRNHAANIWLAGLHKDLNLLIKYVFPINNLS